MCALAPYHETAKSEHTSVLPLRAAPRSPLARRSYSPHTGNRPCCQSTSLNTTWNASSTTIAAISSVSLAALLILMPPRTPINTRYVLRPQGHYERYLLAVVDPHRLCRARLRRIECP